MRKGITQDEFDTRVQRLKELYPYQFRGLNGFEIGRGWVGVIEEMAAHIHAVMPESERQRFVFTQIKEKFGSGRFYWNFNKAVDKARQVDVCTVVNRYEQRAGITCAVCGAPASMRAQGGWLRAVCATHAKSRK